MKKKLSAEIIPAETIESRILLIRGHKIMLDAHLAELYGVETKLLVRAVKRNLERFPVDFMFQLNEEEFKILRFHFGTSSQWGGRRYPPYAFTEQGVAMLSSVLRSKQAIQVNIAIMRAFVRLRAILFAHKELAQKLNQLERKVTKHDEEIMSIFKAIRKLMTPGEKPKRQIGFKAN
jgi:phage regulator Rha-like protein